MNESSEVREPERRHLENVAALLRWGMLISEAGQSEQIAMRDAICICGEINKMASAELEKALAVKRQSIDENAENATVM
jgi:hypothetical protein